MADIDRIKRHVRYWAKANPQVGKVWLFGSRAKGLARDDSDVDIAVELDMTVITDEDAFTYWMYEAETMRSSLQALIPCRVDLQLYRPGSSDRVVSFVEEKSVVLYEKSVTPPSMETE